MKIKPETLKALKGESTMPLYFFALIPLSWLYAFGTMLRALMYRIGLFKTYRLPCKVISVGNITAGGTGKTPMTIYLARRLKAAGLKVAVITRGYKGEAEGVVEMVSDGEGMLLQQRLAGDEATMLAMSLPGIPVVMGSDRYSAGTYAVQRFGPDVVILDDGYQHISLHRDLNILLLDAMHPFGNGRTMPAGYLREPAGAVKRADIVILTRADGIKADASYLGIHRDIPVVRTAHRPKKLYRVWDGDEAEIETLSGNSVYAFSGVADPASFTLILKMLNAKITASSVYPDHHSYKEEDLTEMEARARETGAGFMVTTQKDAVKLAGLKRCMLDVYALEIEIEVVEGADALTDMLADRITAAGTAGA